MDGIVDIVHGGEKPAASGSAEGKSKAVKAAKNMNQNGKRPGDNLDDLPIRHVEKDPPISKRQQKKNKKAKMDASSAEATGASTPAAAP